MLFSLEASQVTLCKNGLRVNVPCLTLLFPFASLDTISSWVVIFILPINSALNPILYTLTTSFFREQVELLLCRWQRRHPLKKDRKSLTSSTIFVETARSQGCQSPAYLQQLSLVEADPRYAWEDLLLNCAIFFFFINYGSLANFIATFWSSHMTTALFWTLWGGKDVSHHAVSPNSVIFFFLSLIYFVICT